jgi:hypothetical protein
MAITESDRIRWSPRRRSAPNADSVRLAAIERAVITEHRSADSGLLLEHQMRQHVHCELLEAQASQLRPPAMPTSNAM